MSKTLARCDASSVSRTLERQGCQAECAFHALGGGVAAYEGSNAGAVDRGHACKVDDQMLLAGAIELSELTLKGFGGSSGNERFLGRQDKTIRNRSSGHAAAIPATSLPVGL